MKVLRETLSAGLAKAREQRDLSQTELAKMVQLEPSAISHFELGRRLPSCKNLLKLADALEISIDELFGRKIDSTWVATPFAARIAKCVRVMKTRDQQTLADLATLIVSGKRVGKTAGCAGDE